MTRFEHIIIGMALVCAIGLYAWKGSPMLADQPFSKRAAEIAQKDLRSLTAPELLTRLQQIAIERPTDPEPHYHIGVVLRSQGRLEDAIRAFQTALRRDDRNVQALVEMGDSLVMMDNGAVGPTARDVYLRAWQLDNNQVRPGILAGYSLQLDGRTDEADALWAAIEATLPEDDPRRTMFDAIVGAAPETAGTAE